MNFKIKIENILDSINNNIIVDGVIHKEYPFYDKYDITHIIDNIDVVTRYDIDDILYDKVNWYQYDTIYDSQYTGTWINIEENLMIAYIEGDLYIFKYISNDRLAEYILQDFRFIGIDAGLDSINKNIINEFTNKYNILNYFDISIELNAIIDNKKVYNSVMLKLANILNITPDELYNMEYITISDIIVETNTIVSVKELFKQL